LKIFATEFRAPLTRSLFLFLAVSAPILIGLRVATAGLTRLKIDPDQSTVSAAVAEPAAMLRGTAVGTFRVIDGEVSGDPANTRGTGRVRIIIDATSYRSDNPSRDRAVAKSLESEKFRTIGFESNSVVGVVTTKSNEGTAIVIGSITLHGETRPMTVPVHWILNPDGSFAGDGEVTFNYEEFGVKVPGFLFGAILAGNEVTVRFHIVAAK
jgi:polyisoprenoid-binding protein YceI